MYSLGNEIVEIGTPHGARLARRMAEHIRSHDHTRLVTNGVNAALAVLDEEPPEEQAAAGLNDLGDSMNRARLERERHPPDRRVQRRARRARAQLRRGPLRRWTGAVPAPGDRRLGDLPSKIGTLWPMVRDNPNVIGDFTWTGWDYLGEVGIGSTPYAEDEEAVASLEREYPFLTAWCGDLDITGWRRPVSYYREIVFGLRTEPYLAVRRPEHHGHTIALHSPWAWSDSVLVDLARLRRSAGHRRGVRRRRRGGAAAGRDRGRARGGRRATAHAGRAGDHLLARRARRRGLPRRRRGRAHRLATAGTGALTAYADRTALRADDARPGLHRHRTARRRRSAGHRRRYRCHCGGLRCRRCSPGMCSANPKTDRAVRRGRPGAPSTAGPSPWSGRPRRTGDSHHVRGRPGAGDHRLGSGSMIDSPVVRPRAGRAPRRLAGDCRRSSNGGGFARSAAFLGIPLRKRRSVSIGSAARCPRAGWDGVRDATTFGPTPQRRPFAEVTAIPEPSFPGDATLNVNVFTPVPGQADANRPVLVWIHGGGFKAGSPSSPWYDGIAFNRDGVVTVSVSYRLGFDGFGWIPDAPHNRGLLDQIEALRWVRRNIAAFGGDPDRVTIAGQSAGGGSVWALLVSPPAAGLFRRRSATREGCPAVRGRRPGERVRAGGPGRCRVESGRVVVAGRAVDHRPAGPGGPRHPAGRSRCGGGRHPGDGWHPAGLHAVSRRRRAPRPPWRSRWRPGWPRTSR